MCGGAVNFYISIGKVVAGGLGALTDGDFLTSSYGKQKDKSHQTLSTSSTLDALSVKHSVSELNGQSRFSESISFHR